MPQLDGDKDKKEPVEGQEPKDTDSDAEDDPKDTEGEAGTADDPKGEDPKEESEDGKDADLPEWAQKERKTLRSEAATWRTKYRDLEKQLADAKTPEEFQTAISEYQTQITNLQRDLVIQRFELNEKQAKRLTGSTLEELEADAKELQELVTAAPDKDVDAGNLGGGLNPEDSANGTNDVAAALKKFGRKRF